MSSSREKRRRIAENDQPLPFDDEDEEGGEDEEEEEQEKEEPGPYYCFDTIVPDPNLPRIPTLGPT